MRAIWKNISSPKIRFIGGGFQRRISPPRHFSDGSESDLKDNQEKMVVQLKDGICWGTSLLRWRCPLIDMVCRDRSSFEFWKTAASTRLSFWTDWVESELDQWGEKNEKERRKDLEARWTYLRDLLNAVGMDTRNHPQLLSVRYTGRGVRFKIASPEKGLTSISNIRLKGGVFQYTLPRQTVNGLVCINTGGAFLIYNPITGERSDWIETTVVREKENQEENRRVNDCIELGFSPTSNRHKVICISSGMNNKSAAPEYCPLAGHPDQQVGAEDQIVEILTVGENIWRKIDEVPPYNVGSESVYVERPYYVNGSMYWRFRYTRNGGEIVMGFDFETEKFRVIPIPEAAAFENFKRKQPIQLTEVDDCLAVVDHQITPQFTSLWILKEDADGSFEWVEERLIIPHESTWNYKGDASIEVLRGTNLIFVQPENSTCFYYCNRDTKEFVRFPISPDRGEESFERIMQL
ncbi:hypothetical protein MKX03_009310 [Papaver bracteatum]|nr:hypothetical protein MKX03_009310 [Papaver bracteatum]